MTQDTRKALKIAGWIYLGYAVIMLVGHVPTFVRELLGGYSYIKFSVVKPTFDLVVKSWFFSNKETWEYRLIQSTDGLLLWHCRLKYVNDRPYQSLYPTDSPWEPTQIHEAIIRIMDSW